MDPYSIPDRESGNESVNKNPGIEVKEMNSGKVIQSQPQMKASTTSKAMVISKGHVVAKGETLYGIAQSYSMTVEELKKMNNLSVDTIFIGQNLEVR